MIDTAVIIAVGNPTHQSKLIYNRTRTMLPAVGKPLIVRTMDRLHRIGIKKYVVILGESDGSLAAFLNSRWLPNAEIEYTLKLDHQPLGRILKETAEKHPQPFFIVGYNSFTHINFPERIRKFLETSPTDLILCGARQSLSIPHRHAYAHINREDAEGYVTEPAYLAEPVARIQAAPSDDHANLILTNFAACGTDFIEYLCQMPTNKQSVRRWLDIVMAYHEDGHRVRVARSSWILQIENDIDLITLNRYLLDENLDGHILSEIPYTVQIHEPVRIDPRVSIGQGAVIGPHVYLEQGSSVGHNAHLRNTLVLSGGVVSANERIQNTIVYGRGRISQ